MSYVRLLHEEPVMPIHSLKNYELLVSEANLDDSTSSFWTRKSSQLLWMKNQQTAYRLMFVYSYGDCFCNPHERFYSTPWEPGCRSVSVWSSLWCWQTIRICTKDKDTMDRKCYNEDLHRESRIADWPFNLWGRYMCFLILRGLMSLLNSWLS